MHKKIVIVGGGPVGLSMALYLARHGRAVTVIDSGRAASDGRVLALSYASKDILARIDSWDSNLATPIRQVQISHFGLGVSHINAQDLNLPELGYTLAYTDLCQQLGRQVASNPLIELIKAKVEAVVSTSHYALVTYLSHGQLFNLSSELVIMAEGGKLFAAANNLFNHDYQQMALVAKIQLKKSFNYRAYERFTRLGPLVLLPFQNSHVMVWALATATAHHLLDSPQQLSELLDLHYCQRLGGARLNGEVTAFPLRLVKAKQRVINKIISIGNSAQTVHPISAQGLNLGLRDVYSLNKLMLKSQLLYPDQVVESSLLQQFDRWRNRDADGVIGFTHSLATLVDNNHELFKHMRGIGIISLSNLPMLQNQIAKRLIYGS